MKLYENFEKAYNLLTDDKDYQDFNEKDCIEKECKCCSNFHLRSGSKINEK